MYIFVNLGKDSIPYLIDTFILKMRLILNYLMNSDKKKSQNNKRFMNTKKAGV